ncbi:hypothetical protein [Paenibacillus ferrarius]|uniref:hypothetical protein n=1 Tax=Paenibacillus ferrarius TaxID=1469647 RepID=UPI003D2D02E6
MFVLNFLNLGITGSIIGIVGIIFGFIFYRKSTIGPRPNYQMASLRLLGKNSEEFNDGEVEILYLGEKVERVTKTQVAFWNSGTSLINGKDIVVSDPLRFNFEKESKVLSTSLISSTREVNQIELKVPSDCQSAVECNFEFLDPGDGFIFEVLHTDTGKYPQLNGTIKGIPKGILNKGTTNYPLIEKNSNGKAGWSKSNIKMGVLGGILIIILVIISIKEKNAQYILQQLGTVSLGVLAGAIMGIRKSRKRFPRILQKSFKG